MSRVTLGEKNVKAAASLGRGHDCFGDSGEGSGFSSLSLFVPLTFQITAMPTRETPAASLQIPSLTQILMRPFYSSSFSRPTTPFTSKVRS